MNDLDLILQSCGSRWWFPFVWLRFWYAYRYGCG